MKNVEDIYPLAPLQSGMLFHSLMSPESGVYVNQVTCTLPADLDSRLFRQAWERLVQRHGVLRTAFLWEGLDEPLQVVRKTVSLPWQELDWRGLPTEEQKRRLEELRHGDRHAPLPLNKAPLMRFSLIRLDRELEFIWTSHHLLLDGWSLPLLVRELVAVYTALREGREPTSQLPSARPFGDYVAWLQKQDGSRAEPFWRKELAGFTAPNSLGLAPPKGAGRAAGSSEHTIRLSREVTSRLQALATRHKLTLQTVTLGAWAVLVSRYSGQEDVVFGGVVSGRPPALPGVEAMVGMFVNTLPVRVRVDGADPLAAWLRRLQERQLARQEFEHTPLAQIQRWSEVPAGSPLFETLYVFENYPDASDGGGSLGIGNLRSFESTNYPLTLAVTAADQVSLHLMADRARVDGDAAARLLQHYATLLAEIAGQGDRHASELRLLTSEEALQLAEWNTTTWDYPQAAIHELFAEQAERSPDAVAVAFAGRKLTYGEIARRARRLAHRLRRAGVGPGSRVGLCAESLPEMVTGMLGILAAGGAYVPLDLAYPPERLAFMLEDTGAAVLVAEEGLAGRLPTREGLGIELLGRGEAGEEEEPIESLSSPGDPAYVIYTSGSTGQPKGVVVPHRAVVRLVRGTDYVQLGPDDRVAQASNSSFDAATFEIWGALLSGARLVGIERETLLSPGALSAVLRRESVSVMFLTTALFNQMAREAPGAFAPLRCVLFGGERVDPAAVRAVLRDGPPETLLHVYGPTETTTFATWQRVEMVPPGETVPIGKPLANGTLYVLAPGLTLQPVGAPGELYLGGDGLAHGYHDRPELTAERFVPDPFGPHTGSRLYRTGDLVRRQPDGAVEFLGRLDGQVKIRGFRIELGEIEAALLELPGVREAAVVARSDGSDRSDRSVGSPGDRRLIAYVTGDAAAAELRQSLRERLPDYMVPAAFVRLEALPLTPNGKVDRKALPAPEEASAAETFLAPRTPVEELVAGLWSELLGVERVGADGDFFELGGHSLLATQVMSRLRQAFGVEIPLHDVFEAPRLADLAARVEAALRSNAPTPAPPLLPVPREGDLPLSFAQERLWLIDQLEPGSPLYNVVAALRAEGPLDPRVLALTLGEIVRRHEALRTVFAARGGAPVQVILPAEPFGLAVVDLSGLPERAREERVPALAAAEAGRPFDLARGPLLRGLLLRLAERDHAVVLTQHHIASDGWSMGVLVREVAALYPAFAEGRPSPLPELPVQYADFAVWQRSWLRGEVLEREIAFWRQQLAGLPPLLELPTDRPRPAMRSFRGAARPMGLPAGLTRQMEALARHEGATLFMVLLAGFQALLARHSGQDDLAVGTPVAGRNRVETEGLIGFFVNTLVLRGDLAGDPTFRELLGRVRETALAAYLHQDVPFEKLVEELTAERSLAHAPLFQVMLVLQNAPLGSLAVEDLRLRPLSVDEATAKFDLTVNLSQQDGALRGIVEHATDLFDATTVDRLFAGFERLLAAAVAGPDLRTAELPLLAEAERHQLLREWGAIREELDATLTLHGRFAARARQTPEASALTCGDLNVTYGELNRRANQLAHWLRDRGAGPESRVGLSLDRSVDLVVGILGVLKAGAAYVPLDPGSPKERLAFILEDAEIRIVVGAEEIQQTEGLPDGDPDLLGDTTSLAYVIYTSGSTGKPKGALITHANVTRLFDATEVWFGFGERDVWTLFHSYTFDFSVWEIWGALLYGGRLVVVPWEVSRSPERFLDLLDRERVTVLNQTPSAFAQIMRTEAALPDLRLVIFGGEALDPASLEPWFEHHGDAEPRLVNMYGITETTVHVTYRPLSAADARGGHRSVIGVPIPDLSLAVMDRSFRPAPIGVPGELVVGGAGLARGYLGRPELTAERFVPDPLGGQPGERLYRSGDLGRFLPNGDVEYIGRLDHQVKIRGFRIELGEIEAELTLAGARQAVVVVQSDGSDRSDRSDRSAGSPGDRRLIAYVTGDATAAELRQSLRERLPDYMVPAVFVRLDALPLTPNGKVDRKALPAPERAEGGYLAPRTPVEEVLACLWAEVLGLERVGVDGHFFELGGHSLLATQVMSRLRQAFGVEMPLRDLFATPVLANFAARVEAARRSGTLAPAPPLLPVPRGGDLPLSFAQQRLWFIDQLEPGSTLYNVPAALRVEGPLDAAVLARCLGEIVRRHEALRTVFALRAGAPVQEIQPAEPFLLPVMDLSALPESAREERVHTLAAAEAGRLFDLTRGPLLRGLLVRLDEREHAVVLTLHHIVSDGWSLGVLVGEVAALYPAFAAGRPSPLPELPVQYADFAVWQRSWLHGEVLEQEIDWWRRQLAGLPPLLELPTDRPRPATQSFRGAARPVWLPAGLTRQAAALARHEGATLFMVLLAAFQTLLARHSGQDDLAVGSPVAGRNRVETEGLIGFFVNTLVLRGDLAGDPTFRELLSRARETALAAYLHQDVPFEKLVEELTPERSLAHAPLFQTVLVLQNAPVSSLEIEDLSLRPVDVEAATAKFDLTLNLSEHEGGLLGFVEHATDLFDATTVDRVIAGFERLLAAAVEDPDLRTAELPLLGAAEQHQLLQEWGAIREEIPATSTLHGRFAARARQTPEAPALTYGDLTVTYGKLDRRANQLARWLRDQGAGPESRVGLSLDRSVDLVIGILGVLKAGAAYVPLDPGSPKERRAFVLEDAEIGIVVGAEELQQLEELPDGDLEPLGDASSLAYVIYTSGSTGRPKGTLITHANVMRLFDATEDWFGFGERDVWTLFHSYAFDFSVWEIWGALLYGGRLVIVPWEVSRSPETFLELIDRERVTVLNQTPSAFAQIAQTEAPLPDLRLLIFGGEALDPTSLEPWFERHGDERPRLVNMYGITETTVHVTYRPLRATDTRSVIGVP
ncbi:MAG TPA: amino acid adenylation domain-containing protein, partial [Thermoanaerobaculia bacterium]|nr:amino acid adenylation domain-containing protein [Thermoanaerobaculia bacterium]